MHILLQLQSQIESMKNQNKIKKKKIRLLDPEVVDTFVDEFKVLMKESII